jgi:hypothetical protein
VRPAAACPAEDLGEFLSPSVVDGDLVALAGPLLWLLAGPAQLPLEDLADVLGVEAHLEVPLDQVGDPGGGPQLGAPAVGHGPLQEQLLKPLAVRLGEARVRPGWGLAARAEGSSRASFTQVETEERPQPRKWATSSGDPPSLTNSTARSRRRCNSSAVPMGLMPSVRNHAQPGSVESAGVNKLGEPTTVELAAIAAALTVWIRVSEVLVKKEVLPT